MFVIKVMWVVIVGFGVDFELFRIRKCGILLYVVEFREIFKGSFFLEIFVSLEDSILFFFFFIYENDWSYGI